MAADLRRRVVQVNGIAALHQHAGALGARRAGADHQYGVLGGALREFLRVPAAAIFLAGGGVLRANHRRPADFPARNAYIAADADADVVVAAFLDLLRQPGIGDRGARRADDVGDALGDDLGHLLRVGETADPEHGFLGHLFDESGPGNLVALLVESGRPGVLAPLGDVAHVHVPQIDQRVGQGDELHAVILDLDAGVAVERIDGEAGGDGRVVAHGAADFFQGLEPEARAIFQRAAVFVLALVVIGREKLQRQVGVRTVDVDDIEAGIAGAQCGVHVVLLDHGDVVQVHFLAVGEGLELGGVLARSARRRARFHARCMRGAVPKLHSGEGAEFMDVVGHGAQIAHIPGVPDARRQAVRVVRFGMNRAIFGIDSGPAALGLQRAMRRLEPGLVGTGADAMRHLVEPVAQRFGTDFDRLKQNVVFWVARHARILWLCIDVYLGRTRPPRRGARIIFSIERRSLGSRRADGKREADEGSARAASEINSMSVTVVQIYCVQCKLTCKRMEAAIRA